MWRQFFSYLATFVQTMVDKAPMPLPYEPVPLSYNPGETGIALYFHPEGLRGRDLRYYGERKGQGETTTCNKNYGNYRNRSGGVFTFFCQHGTCWGGFIIPHAEGCRDPFMVIVALCVCKSVLFSLCNYM